MDSIMDFQTETIDYNPNNNHSNNFQKQATNKKIGNYLKETDKLNEQSEQIISLTMQKISNFLQMKNISIHDFWLTNRNYASPQDILSFCAKVGLIINIHDQINMKAEIFNDRQIISIYEFCEHIPFWKDDGTGKGKQMVSDFLKKRSQILIEQLQSKQKDKKRPKSSNFARGSSTYSTSNSKNLQFQNHNMNQSKRSRQISTQKLRRQTQTRPENSSGFQYNQNNSLKYLHKHKEREQLMQKQLAQTIDKTKNEYQYGMLLKMSEMNENNRQKNNNQTYRAYKSAQGIIRVRIFQLNKFIKQINLKQFDRIYKSFKKNTKQNKDWTIQPTSTAEKQIDVHSLKVKNARKADRQQQLKNLLVNTVNLTNLLKDQIKIFKTKGIYGSQQI